MGKEDTARKQYFMDALQSDVCLVADQQELLGLIVLKSGHFFGRDFVDYLRVRADHRRSGIGRRLLLASLSAATSARVFTSTNESNLPMRALLAVEGWQFSGRLDGLDEDDPELVYFCDLK